MTTLHETETNKEVVTVADNLVQSVIRKRESETSGDGGASGERKSIAQRVMEHAGQYDGKYMSNVSLSTHTLNVTFVGLSACAYELVHGDCLDKYDNDDMGVLIAALLLHDVNKYVSERDGQTEHANTGEVLDTYLETDDFGVVGELIDKDDRDNVLYLIQHTEQGETASESLSNNVPPRIRDLARYCRIGDGVCSVVHREGINGAKKYLERQFKTYDESPVQLIQISQTPRPMLQELIVTTTKQKLEGRFTSDTASGVVIGSTPNGILMLGEHVSNETVKNVVVDDVKRELADFTEFKPKVGWNSFEYDSLKTADIPVVEKRATLVDEWVELLHSGTGGFESVEQVPDGFKEIIPEITYRIYYAKDHEFVNAELQKIASEVKEKSSDGTYRVYLLAELAKEYSNHSSLIESWAKEYEKQVEEVLETKASESPVGEIVSEVFTPLKSVNELSVPGAAEQCFLCGEHTTERYSKGSNSVYSTHSFSKRGKAGTKYKNICSKCNVEYPVLEQHIENHDIIYTGNDILTVYVRPGVFTTHVVEDNHVSPSTTISNGLIDFGETTPEITSFTSETQISLIKLDMPRRSTQQVHLENVRRILQYIHETGVTVEIGGGFNTGESTGYIFYDANPCRIQSELGINEIETRDELRKYLKLFDVLAKAYANEVNNPYTKMSSDSFEELVQFNYVTCDFNSRRKNVNKSSMNKDIREYIQAHHEEQLMQMKTVAKHGQDLHGEIHGSKHAKTKTFKNTLDALIEGLSNGMEDNVLKEMMCAEAYNSARNEQYAGRVTSDQAKSFVEALFEYLDTHDYVSLKRLIDEKNTLVNVYLFASDELLYSDEEQE